ncbi:hypothetical protein RQP46_004017 [Phenoliferia psychrophenolica]
MSAGPLNEDILQHVASFADAETLAAMALVSKATQRLVTRRLYTHITIKHERQYLPLLQQANFVPLGPSPEYPLDRMPLEAHQLPPPASYATSRSANLSLLRTLECLVPPPATFTQSLILLHPHLERDPASLAPSRPKTHSRFEPTFLPLRLARFEIHTTEDDYAGSFGSLARLFDPEEFVVHSLEPWAQCWRMSGACPRDSWVSLSSIEFDNCLPLRPDMGDMPESFALPYMCHPLLRKVTVNVTKWDATEEGILDQIGWQVPFKRGGEHGEWPRFETFLVRVSGEKRLEKAKKKVLKVIGWEGKELKRNVEERLRWELVEGQVPEMPEEWEGEEEEEDAKEYDEWDGDEGGGSEESEDEESEDEGDLSLSE